MLKVVVMTQQDRFYIPQNIQKAIDTAEVLAIANIDCENALHNKLRDFVIWFGFYQVMKMGFVVVLRIAAGMLDRLSGYKLYNGLCGVEHVARKNKIKYIVSRSSNSEKLYRKINRLNPDVIISFSAPEVIKEPLLSYPRYGILNVHGSLLPDYRGCMPSFWYLYNEEHYGGATVHYMSDRIDDGDIVRKSKVYIGDCQSIFSLTRKTKKIGGEMMVEVLRSLESGVLERVPNNVAEGRYFSWPSPEQGREFRRKGKRLI